MKKEVLEHYDTIADKLKLKAPEKLFDALEKIESKINCGFFHIIVLKRT